MTNNISTMNQSDKILLAAFRCIASKGYANVSLRDIANEAGVVLSQLNYYFKNKEGLLTELIRMMVKNYLTEIENCLKIEKNPKKRAILLIKYFQRSIKKNPENFKVLYDFTQMALWSNTFKGLMKDLYKDLSKLIEKYLFADINKEELKEHSPSSLSRFIVGAMLGTTMQVLIDDEEDILMTLDTMNILFD
ncbi:TetR family transcriptional regulator [Natranaerovirga hydrolytica]|uniref:TetR family transcriptional regulator n=1 Tax=Natranaerovirga hydrolytica TaxID=680378 RepID=A0A4V2Q0E1_9FIRM|nr:TetR/AcrR family transcriptional regulator [Natranaerovirga hydrolytica]TCK93451.1 TetR family transcriptional regulator [Natranaerovirga hydrolytica]